MRRSRLCSALFCLACFLFAFLFLGPGEDEATIAEDEFVGVDAAIVLWPRLGPCREEQAAIGATHRVISVYVVSSVHDAHRRQAVRQTWAKDARAINMDVVFAIQAPSPEKDFADASVSGLHSEAEVYGDVLSLNSSSETEANWAAVAMSGVAAAEERRVRDCPKEQRWVLVLNSADLSPRLLQSFLSSPEATKKLHCARVSASRCLLLGLLFPPASVELLQTTLRHHLRRRRISTSDPLLLDVEDLRIAEANHIFCQRDEEHCSRRTAVVWEL